MAIVVVSVSHPQILAFLLYPLHKILAANGCNQNAAWGGELRKGNEMMWEFS